MVTTWEHYIWSKMIQDGPVAPRVVLGAGIQFKRHISPYIWCIEIEKETFRVNKANNERKHSLIYSIISANTIDTNYPLSYI